MPVIIKTTAAELSAIVRQAHRQVPGDVENPSIEITFGMQGIVVNGEALNDKPNDKESDPHNLEVAGKD